MRKYEIPYYGTTNATNKETIKNAVQLLLNNYRVDSEFMETPLKLEFLETVVNLTDLYLNMEEARQ